VVDWFETPLAALDGAKPIDVLSDASETERLLELAVSTRSLSAA
jgi:uncharacterized protein (DUF2384 family)